MAIKKRRSIKKSNSTQEQANMTTEIKQGQPHHDSEVEADAVSSEAVEAEATEAATQEADEEQVSAQPVGNRFSPPTEFRSKRKRKAPQASKRQMKLVRMALKEAAVASPQSVELWVLIKIIYNGHYQTEEIHLVAPELQDLLEEKLRPIKVQVILNQDGSHSLLYTKLTDGYENSWMDSAEACSEQLEQGWGRVVSERSLQEYIYSPVNTGKPVPAAEAFPDLNETIEQVFADRIVSDLYHPVLEEMGIYIDPEAA